MREMRQGKDEKRDIIKERQLGNWVLDPRKGTESREKRSVRGRT